MSHVGRRALARRTAARGRTFWAAGAGAVAVAVVVALIVLARPPPVEPIHDAGEPTLGEATAPVTVFYYADFQCPFCARFELGGAMESLRDGRIAAGEARLVVKDFPILGADSIAAARASQFVWESAPADYWAWHRGLFEIQGPERSGWASPDRIVAFSARFAAIDPEALRAAMADGSAVAAEVADDAEEGEDHGVRSTPTLVVAGRVYNALDVAAVDAAIAEALAGGSG